MPIADLSVSPAYSGHERRPQSKISTKERKGRHNWRNSEHQFQILFQTIVQFQYQLWQSKNLSVSGWWFGTFFIFHNMWDNYPNWLSYFSRWLKPPTSCQFQLFVKTKTWVKIHRCSSEAGDSRQRLGVWKHHGLLTRKHGQDLHGFISRYYTFLSIELSTGILLDFMGF